MRGGEGDKYIYIIITLIIIYIIIIIYIYINIITPDLQAKASNWLFYFILLAIGCI